MFGVLVDVDGTLTFRERSGLDEVESLVGGWPVESEAPNGEPLVVYSADGAEGRGLRANPLASAIGGLWPSGGESRSHGNRRR